MRGSNFAYLVLLCVSYCLAVGDLGLQSSVALARSSRPVSQISWRSRTPSPIPASEADGTVAAGKLYRLGGYNSQRIPVLRFDSFDPVTNLWSSETNLPVALTHAPTPVDGQYIYQCGGFIGQHPGPSTSRIWRYDTVTKVWSTVTPLPDSRGAGGCVILNGKMYYFGGAKRAKSGGTLQDKSEHWVLDLNAQANGWKVLAPMPNPRNHIASAAVDGKVYAIGGQHGDDEDTGEQNEMDVYDPATNVWSKAPRLPLSLGHIASGTFVYRNQIGVIGGDTFQRTTIKQIFIYDPKLQLWSTLGNMPVNRKSVVGGEINGTLYFTTGTATGVAGGSTATYEGTVSTH